MIMPTRPAAVEALETRIAPAQFFLSGTALTVENADGDSVNDGSGAMSAGVNLAVLLKKGDSLVLDTNDNNKLDEGEVVYAKVAGGSAMFLVTDVNEDMTVDPEEITGIAVSHKFKGVITGDVNGTVATLLKSDGAIDTEELQASSISGMVVTGRITGDLRVGKDMNNVTIGAEATGDGLGVQRILVGTAASETSFSLNGGITTVAATFTQAEGEAGGSINNVKVYKGAMEIIAGSGSASATGNGGAGGKINKLTLIDALAKFDIRGGNGGNSTAMTGVGGAGGAVKNLNLTFASDVAEESPRRGGTIAAGAGGNGNSGGDGGEIRNVNMNFKVDALHWFYLNAGSGGSGNSGGQTGNGGDGGNLINARVTNSGKNDFVGFYAGSGGNAGENGNGKGGNGGTVMNATYEALGGEYGPYAYAGDGGNGQGTGKGGRGGSLLNVRLDIGDIKFSSYSESGEGGDAETGAGGAAGLVKSFRINVGQATEGGLFVQSGNGGESTGTGGNAGAITNVSLQATGSLGAETGIVTGRGGNGATGGKAGGIKAASIETTGSTQAVHITTGPGGNGTTGNGGDAGSIANSRITNSSGSVTDLRMTTGNGGVSTVGNGGDAGSLTNSQIEVAGGTAATAAVFGGRGGNGTDGGRGANIINFKITSVAALTGRAEIDAGSGGNGSGDGGRGGDSGSISKIAVSLPDSILFVNPEIVSGGASGTGAGSKGGNGGAVSGLTGRVGTLILSAADGGIGVLTGGKGGAVKNINLTQVDDFVRLIRAGDGGDGLTPGAGGSLSNIKVAGDIGDFASNFGIDTNENLGMGGLIAGQAGATGGTVDVTKNGSISNITATRIAAILAGAPAANAINGSNAVVKISGLKNVTTVGADVGGDTAFDFTDAGPAGFNLGDGDTAIDGLVVVLTDGYESTVVPLKLIEVNNA